MRLENVVDEDTLKIIRETLRIDASPMETKQFYGDVETGLNACSEELAEFLKMRDEKHENQPKEEVKVEPELDFEPELVSVEKATDNFEKMEEPIDDGKKLKTLQNALNKLVLKKKKNAETKPVIAETPVETVAEPVLTKTPEKKEEKEQKEETNVVFSQETANDMYALKTELANMIQADLSKNQKSSVVSNGVTKYSGVFIKSEIALELKKGGSIHAFIEKTYGVQLKCKGVSGKKIKFAAENDFERYATITW